MVSSRLSVLLFISWLGISSGVCDERHGLRSCPRGSILPAMDASESCASLSREELLTLVAELRRQMAELTARNAEVRAEIDQPKRGSKRQAALFSKGTRVTMPKPLGRKPGSGPLGDCEAPPPEDIMGLPVDVYLPPSPASCERWKKRYRFPR